MTSACQTPAMPPPHHHNHHISRSPFLQGARQQMLATAAAPAAAGGCKPRPAAALLAEPHSHGVLVSQSAGRPPAHNQGWVGIGTLGHPHTSWVTPPGRVCQVCARVVKNLWEGPVLSQCCSLQWQNTHNTAHPRTMRPTLNIHRGDQEKNHPSAQRVPISGGGLGLIHTHQEEWRCGVQPQQRGQNKGAQGGQGTPQGNGPINQPRPLHALTVAARSNNTVNNNPYMVNNLPPPAKGLPFPACCVEQPPPAASLDTRRSNRSTMQ